MLSKGEYWSYQSAINAFDWENGFSIIDVDKMVYTFNKTIISILFNFIPHETILSDDRNSPWMNKEVKKLIQQKKNISFVSVEIITTSSY